MQELFGEVNDGIFTGVMVTRGGTYAGKRLGKNSPDSTYIALGLLPIVGDCGVYDTETQRVGEITYEVNPSIGAGIVARMYHIEDITPSVPTEVSMAQFRAALINSGIKDTIDAAVANSKNELLISDYEYRATVKRDWGDLVTMAAQIGITDEQIDEVFILAKSK